MRPHILLAAASIVLAPLLLGGRAAEGQGLTVLANPGGDRQLAVLGPGDRQLGVVHTGTGAVTLRCNPLTGRSFTSFWAAMDGDADRYSLVGEPSGGSPTVYTLGTVPGLELDAHVYTSGGLDTLAAGFDPSPLFADTFVSANFNAWSIHP